MLTVDITGTLGKTITPSKGIPEQELMSLKTTMKRYTEAYLKERERGEHAWTMDPYDKRSIQQVKEVAEFAMKEKIRTVVWVGIGGSGLGPKVIQEFLEGPDTIEFILLDTLDPAILQMYTDLIDWKKAMVVVASKSGGTLEPMSVFFHCFSELKKARGDKANEYIVALTDPHKGKLRSYCLEKKIRMLHIPTAVGGRYSVFTPVGLLPVALLGGDVDAFVKGAIDIDTTCQDPDFEKNPAALLACAQFILDTKRGYPIRVIMPYSQRLESVARWSQQLVAESLGKNELNNPIPLAAIGTQDQHSLLQQWMQGPRKGWHLFIREEEMVDVRVPEDTLEESFGYIANKSFGDLLTACYQGTSQALTNVNRPHATISLQRLDEEHLGQLFFLLLTEVVLLGKLYRIDPYGQPGVEMGKTITKELLGGE